MADTKPSTSFKTYSKPDEPEKTNDLFNRPDDGKSHGHVVTSNDGLTTHYARDEDGNVYVDDSKPAPPKKP